MPRADHCFGPPRQRRWHNRASFACFWCRQAPPVSACGLPRLGGGRACNLDLAGVQLAADALLATAATRWRKSNAWSTARWQPRRRSRRIMQIMLDMTLDYTRSASNSAAAGRHQVIRHASPTWRCNATRRVRCAARRADGDADPVARGRAASGAKAKIGKCARFVAEQSSSFTAPWGHRGTRYRLLLQAAARLDTCSAAAPIIIAVTPHWAGDRFNLSGAQHGPYLQCRRARLEQEIRDFIAANLSAEMKHAQSLTPSVFSDPEIGIAWQKSLHKKGWGAPGCRWNMADPTDLGAALDFRAECAPRRRAERQRHGRQDGRPRHHRLWLAGAEEFLSATDSFRRRLLCQGYSSPVRAPTSPR